MKKFWFLCLSIWICITLHGQTNLTGYTYWFDDDMGSTFTNVFPSSSIYISEVLDCSSLVEGMHTFNLRSVDDSGRWSSVMTHHFYKFNEFDTLWDSKIDLYQYWIDDYSIINEQIAVPTDVFLLYEKYYLDTIEPGIHSFHLRFRDDRHAWSSIKSHFFYRYQETQPPGIRKITRCEYWIDNLSSKFTQELSPSGFFTLSEILTLDTLNEGLHHFNIRIKDDSNQCSSVHTQWFYKYAREAMLDAELVNMEYWFDNNLADQQTAVISPEKQYTFLSDIDLTDFENGLHSFNCRFKDNSCKYSSVMTHLFYIFPEHALTGDNYITSYRVIYDNNPKLVQDFVIKANNENFLILDVSIPPPPLEIDTHIVAIQFQDEKGLWSSVIYDTLVVENEYPAIFITPTSKTIGSASGQTIFSVISNVDWTVAENSTWFTASKTIDSTIAVIYDVNSGLYARYDSMVVSGPGAPSKTLYIQQMSAESWLQVLPQTRTVSAAAGATTFKVSSNVTWSVIEDTEWLSAAITNDSTLTVSYTSNIGINPRMDTLLITGPGLESIIVTISQDGGNTKDLSVAWLEPTSEQLCGLRKEQSIKIKLENYGLKAISNFVVGYSIDGGLSFAYETVTVTVVPDSPMIYTFRQTADMAEKDTFRCVALVNLPEDQNLANNRAEVTVMNDRLVFNLKITDTDCKLAEGIAEITDISGRPGSYDIYWSTGDTTLRAENMAAGTYNVTIIDPLGCAWSKPVTIRAIGAPEIDMSSSRVIDVSCNRMKDGIIFISPTGGSPPYNYHWSDGETTQAINNLAEGEYDVKITDSEGCASSYSFVIGGPNPLKVTFNTIEANCGEADGVAEIFLQGGTPPFMYTWSSGHTGNIATDLPGGVYSVKITHNNGCIDSARISINEINAPDFQVTSVIPASCGASDGSIDISLAEDGLDCIFEWSDGTSAEDLLQVPEGIYNVTVSLRDGNCSKSQVAEIPVKQPSPGSICMVTVDSSTNGNMVILNDPVESGDFISCNIYKLSKTGAFQYIGTRYPGVSNTLVDEASDVETTSYRYRMTQLDSCGNESEPSVYHETMHIVVNKDNNGEWANLFWNAYKGVDYNYFQIWRYSEHNGLEIIDTVFKAEDKNYYSYTDKDPSDTVYYMIVIELSEACSSIIKAGTHNTIRSNKSKKLKFPANLSDNETVKYLNVYPNPNKGTFRISLESLIRQDIVMNIYDSQGKLIWNYQIKNIEGFHEKLLELQDSKPGLYHIQLILNDGMRSKSFVLE